MATKIKLGNGQWGVKENGLLAYNDEDAIFKAIEMDFSRSSTATKETSAGTIGDSPLNTPRIDFTDDANGALLLEPQSTNLITYSEEFDNADWLKLGIGSGVAPVVTANQGIAPDGTLTADRVVFDTIATGGGDYSNIYDSFSLDGVSEYTISFYVKSNTGLSQELNFLTNSSNVGLVNVTTEWTRVSSTFTSSTTTARNFGLSARGTIQSQVDILIWGAQLEQQSYATSLIPTSGATATRIAETCSKSGLGSYINSSEGVLYVEMSALADDGTDRLIGVSDGTTSNRLGVFYSSTTNFLSANLISGGSVQVNMNVNAGNQTDVKKIAFKYKENDFALWVNGVEVATDSSGSTFSSGVLGRLGFDAYSSSVAPFYGKVKDLRVYSEALPDSELATLTTI